MFKKGLCLLLTVITLFSLSGCSETWGSAVFLFLVATGDDRADKEDIFDFVRENEDALRKAIEAGDYSAFEHQGFIKDVSADESVVEFSCGGAGVGSGTAYVGFYYTPDNNMTALWCAPSSADSLKPFDGGYMWTEENGDNQYYTEKIRENFYYYEASF